MVEFYCPKCCDWSYSDDNIIAGNLYWKCPRCKQMWRIHIEFHEVVDDCKKQPSGKNNVKELVF